MKRLLIGGIIILCMSCTPMDIVKTVMPKPAGISAQIGKEANKQIVGTQEKIEVDADISNITQKEQEQSIYGAVQEYTVNNVQSVSIWIWALCIAGWVLPTPQTMFNSWRKRKTK